MVHEKNVEHIKHDYFRKLIDLKNENLRQEQ